jgi:hypothetical protein
MAAAVMGKDLDSGTNPPAYEDLKIAKMFVPLFVELRVPRLNRHTKKTDLFRSFLYGLCLSANSTS